MHNDFSGTADQAFQAGGDITINDYRSPARERPPEMTYQPPAAPLRFVNRAQELNALRGQLTGGSTAMVVLSGMPGVGTSSTALRSAEDMGDLYPGGVLYVDFAELAGASGGGADVRGAQSHVLRSAFGVADRYLSVPGAELAARYRDKTRERGPILLVLENVTHPAQASALIPAAAGSAVVVTSHRRLEELVMDGAHLMPLEPLDAPHALELLATLCGAHRVASEAQAAARLVERCQGLPLALKVVGARLAGRPRLGLAFVLEELEAESGRLAALSNGSDDPRHSVSAALGVACRHLPPAALRLYRLLGLLPGRTFHLDAAVALDDSDRAAVGPLLEELRAASLVDEKIVAGRPTGRYAMHDLVRLHARALAETDDGQARHAALCRLVDHYTVRTAFADRAVMPADRLRITDHSVLLAGHEDPFPGPDARDRALDWLEAERAGALGVLRTAVARGLDRQAAELAEGLTALYLNHRHLTDWIESGRLGAEAAARLGNRALEARLRSLLSRPLMDIGSSGEARKELDRALELADGTPDLVLRASVREFSARYWDAYEPAAALAQYEEALALNAEAGQWRGVALVLYFMGCTQDATGEHGRALATLADAHDRLAAIGDRRMAGRALAALGVAHVHAGNTRIAVRILMRAAWALRRQRARPYEAQVRETLADLALRDGSRTPARRQLARALELHALDGGPKEAELRERLEALGEG
ncbi:NB-ARC domain-containing protein [Streptomyces sp. NPDC049555]|uniref:NB-ARC domain-containing protein n=1 Tax=Streptomyces sp. NPDC049555 TaxID=3154930 RepID=UPI00343CB360